MLTFLVTISIRKPSAEVKPAFSPLYLRLDANHVFDCGIAQVVQRDDEHALLMCVVSFDGALDAFNWATFHTQSIVDR